MKIVLPMFKTSAFSFFVFSLFSMQQLNAQAFTDAGSYISYMSAQHREIMKDYMSYTSAVAHGKSARKVENRRQTLMQTLNDSRRKIASMAPYQGDKSLRDSTAKYLLISYHILNDDYGKIMNLEEVAEQSYDAMEAYLLAQEIASDKVGQANENLKKMERGFAAKHNITIVDTKDELSEKVEQTNQINEYHKVIYLIFFKSYKQEIYMLDALHNKNINAIEQNKNTLQQYAEEGMSKLKTISAFKGDNSLITACRQLQEFYKQECTDKMSVITNFYLKEENFNKIKKAFEAKREKERTQADVDQYNKALNELNKAGEEFNKINKQLNASRTQGIENWNKVSQNFLDKHTPRYK